MRATRRRKWPPFPGLLDELKRSGIHCEVVYLLASDEELLRRYAETRRKHPLSSDQRGLHDAIQLERELLAPIANAADRIIDTSRMGLHDLRHLVHRTVGHEADGPLTITFESFGFKRGIPGDADFVFDARTLPNPYWEPTLRQLTGRDPAVIEFLKGHPAVQRLIDDIESFHHRAHRRIPGDEPRLSDRRGRLHRRPPSLGVRGGTAAHALHLALSAGHRPAQRADRQSVRAPDQHEFTRRLTAEHAALIRDRAPAPAAHCAP